MSKKPLRTDKKRATLPYRCGGSVLIDPIYNTVSDKINQSLALLTTAQSINDLSAKQIHQLRVMSKELRAGLQLYSTVIGKAKLRAMTQQIKQLADHFSGQRDIHVQQQRLTTLLKIQPKPKVKKRLFNDLFKINKQAMAVPDYQWLKAHCLYIDIRWSNKISQSKKVRQAIKRNKDETAYAHAGLQKTYAHAAKLGRKALDSGIDAHFHRWRKWTKHLYYQLSLWGQLDSTEAVDYLKRLKRLGSDLGIFHDDCVLAQTIHSYQPQPDDQRVIAHLKALLDTAKADHKQQVSEQFASLFDLSRKSQKQVLRLG